MILRGNISVRVTSGFSAVTNSTILLYHPINKFIKQIALVQMHCNLQSSLFLSLKGNMIAFKEKKVFLGLQLKFKHCVWAKV